MKKVLTPFLFCIGFLSPANVFPAVGDYFYAQVSGITMKFQITKEVVVYSSTSFASGAVNLVRCLSSETQGEISIPGRITHNGYYYGVGGISEGAFSGCSGIESISLPSAINSIGKSAFYGCSSLTSINIPSDVRRISENTFRNCSSLREIDFQGHVSYIDASAFEDCVSLTSLIFPWELTIYANAFKGCKNLNTVIFKDEASLRENAFSDCSSLSSVYSYMTNLSNLTNSNVFQNIHPEATLYVPNGMKSIYEMNEKWKSAFLKISTIMPAEGDTIFSKIPLSRELCLNGLFIMRNSYSAEIELIAFEDNTPLMSEANSEIVIPSTIIDREAEYQLTEIGDSLFYDSKITSLSISEGVKCLHSYAFANCLKLSNVRLPKSLCNIDKAFKSCENLRECTVQWRRPSNCIVDLESFSGLPNDVVLNVPAGTKELYEQQEVWGRFSQINESSPISTGDICAKYGSRVDLPIYLKNNVEIAGLQFMLTFPEGVSVEEKGDFLIASITERTEGLKTMGMKSPDEDNSYLFVMFSLEGHSISGMEGAILNIPLNIGSDMSMGDYEIKIEDVQMATSAFETLIPADAISDLTIRNYALGDVNDDGYIDVADLTAAVKFILGNASSNLLFKAADVDESGIVEINDYSAVVNMVLAQEDGSQFMGTKRLYTNINQSLCTFTSDTTFVKHNGEGEALISLLKDGNLYTGLQFDLSLPEGLDFASDGVSAISKKHDVILTKKSNGDYRVVCTSDNNSVLCGDSTILRLRLKNVGAMTGIHEMTMYNVVLSDSNAVRHEAEAQLLHIMVGDEITGLPEIESNLDISVEQGTLTLKAHSRQTVTIVTMSGLVIDTFEMNDGETKTLKIGTGIFVVNDKKIINI